MYINNVIKNSVNTASIIKRIAICLFVLVIIACSSKPPILPAVTKDFCSSINGSSSLTLSEHLSPFHEQMKNKTGVYVLEQGTEAMLSRAWLSDHAQKTIDVQYFIFSSDNVGLIATDYLVKAAERGVKVRVLVDDIMVDASGDELLKLAADENFSIKIYNPKANVGKNIVEKLFNLTTDFHGLNQRMHNKTFTVDGKVSITGGRNVADEYFGYDHQFNFRDRDVLLVGGITHEIERSFNQFWGNELSVPVEQLITSKHKHDTNYDALHQYACDPLNFVPQVRDQINDIPKAFLEVKEKGQFHWLEDVEYISDMPGKNDKKEFLGGGGLSTDRLVSLVNNAKKSVIIQTPYLVTTSLSRNLFKAIVDRGVEVKILTNSLASNDNLEAFSGYQRDRKALLETGALIYEFKPDAQIRKKIMSDVMHNQLKDVPIFGLHAKSMVIDDEITVIGTFNVDPRSANLNTESITIIPSREIARSVKKGMLEEMKPENAWQTTLNWNPDGEVGYLKRFSVKLRRIVPKGIL